VTASAVSSAKRPVRLSTRIRILVTPAQAPQANAVAERWVGTLRRELLDRMLVRNQRQLYNAVTDYVDHYN
jgi:putative transposase